jgi:putative flippase GtrA
VSGIVGRWLKFNFVGGLGIGVQLAALWMLVHWVRLHYLAATALAVETAVLHNFVWHERFTWRKRAGGSWRKVGGRLLRFQVANGLISLIGNLAIMRLLVGVLGVNPLIANGVAIAVCSLANFAAGEWFVFRGPGR